MMHPMMPTAPRTRIDVATLTLSLLLASCGGSPPPSAEQRTFKNPEIGVQYVVPPNWWVLNGEARSRLGTLFTIDATNLQDASPEFVAGLPDSVLPQLEDNTRRFFSIVEKPARREVTVGGEPALEVVFPVRVRPQDRPGEVAFRVVRSGNMLYLLRTVFTADGVADDRPLMAEALATFKFLERPVPSSRDSLVPQLPATAATPVP